MECGADKRGGGGETGGKVMGAGKLIQNVELFLFFLLNIACIRIKIGL